MLRLKPFTTRLATGLAALARTLLIVGMAALPTGAAGCRRGRPLPETSAAAVVGRVANADGKPLGGAQVSLLGDPDDGRVPMGSARASASGAFRIDRVPAGRYRLRARAAGHVETIVSIELPGVGGGKPIELKLPATVALVGRIEDERHTRVPLARVLAFAVADVESRTLHETRADDQGMFTLAGLAPGAHRLLIEAPGLGTASAGPVNAPDEDVLVVVPGRIRAIIGRVTRDRQPVANARVLLGGEGVSEARATQTSGDGRFVFGGLGPGTYFLRAEQGGFVAPVLAHAVVDRAPSQTRAVELSLAPGSFLHGRVVSENGAPVAGASVQIALTPGAGLVPTVSADTGGQWTSPPLGPGTYSIRARHPGAVARRTLTVDVGRPVAPGAAGATATPPALTLELVRTGKIIGRVVDERGRPLAGASITDRLAVTENLGVIWARLPMAAEAAALPSGTVLPSAAPGSPASRRATTDAAGAFVLNDVAPGLVGIEVLNPSSVPLRTSPVALAPGATLDVGTLRVQGAIQLSGRVLDGDGHPLGGARVAATRLSAPVEAGAGLYAVTADDGMFSLPLSAGEHRLTASARGQADASETIRVVGVGAPTPFVTLRLAKAQNRTGNLVLQGVVRDAERRPLAGARISVRGGEEPGAPASGGGGQTAPLATAVADAGGGFRLTGLSSAPATIEVNHDRYPVHRQVVDVGAVAAAGQSLEIHVPMPGGIDGEVHERLTGGPVGAFRIEARGPDGASVRYPAEATRRRPGGPLAFSLRRLKPGRWTLRVEAPGFRTLEHEVEVTAAGSLGDASVRGLRLELERGRAPGG